MDLFNDNIDLVKVIVNKFNYGYVDKEDLMQAGLMGLFSASKSFKANVNVKFNTYATYFIIGEIKKELRENKLIKLNKKIYKIIRTIKGNQDLGIEQLIDKYSYSKEAVLEALIYMNNIFYLDKEDGAINKCPAYEKKNIVNDAVESLDVISQDVIKLRYFQNYSQNEVGTILKENQSKISRIEKNALIKIRKYLLTK